MLRLLPDHGVYFEFVPVTELSAGQPVRHCAAEIEPGVPYSLAVTSPAGLWACVTGVRVRFERREPPLLRLLETSVPQEQTRCIPAADPRSAVHPFPPQPPHLRNGTIPGPGPRKEAAISQ
jgi:hypothetical protein